MASSLGDALGSADVKDDNTLVGLLPASQATHVYLYDSVSDTTYLASVADVRTLLFPNSAPNQLPLVQLAISANGIILGASTTLTATATDPDGTIASVTFFDGTQVLAALTTAPYTYVYTPSTVGSRNIKVVAIDNQGGGAQDTLPLVVVAGAPVVAPTPVITFAPIAPHTVGDGDFQLTATSNNTGSGAPAIAFTSSDANIVSVASTGGVWRATVVGVGTATITASQAAGNGYLAGSATQQAVVNPVQGNPTFTQTLSSGQNVDTLIFDSSNGAQVLYNNPVQATASSPGSNVMSVFLGSTQIGQLNYDPLDEGHPCAVKIGSTTYYRDSATSQYLVFTNASVFLV